MGWLKSYAFSLSWRGPNHTNRDILLRSTHISSMRPTTWVFLLRFYIVLSNNPLTYKRQSAKLCLTTCTCLSAPGRTWRHRKSLHRWSNIGTLVQISNLYVYVNKILSWFPLCQSSLCKALPVLWWPTMYR